MLEFYQEGKPSTKCYRKKHDRCRNLSQNCNCSCHRVAELNREKSISDLQILDDRISMEFRQLFN